MESKKLFIMALLASTLAFSLEGELKTGSNITFDFKSKEDNLKTDNNEETFTYNKTSYDLNLIDLNLKDKKYGFSFGSTLKSSRKNILINDWSNEEYLKLGELKDNNHDIQAKIFLNWKYPKESILGGDLGFEYYIHNFLKKKIISKGEMIEEDTYEYEFIDKDKKYLGGDFITRANLTANPIKDLKLSLNSEYMANRIVDYTKGYPYILVKNNLEYKNENIGDFKFNHEFNYNLRSLVLPYKEEKEKEDEESFSFLNNYVRRYRQKFDMDYLKNIKEDKYSINVNIKDNGYYIGDRNKEDKTQIINHRVEFNTKFSAMNKLKYDDIDFYLTNNLTLENKYDDSRYLNNKTRELWALIRPVHNFELKLEKKIDNFTITPLTKFETKLIFPLTKGIFKSDYFLQKYKWDVDFNSKYTKDKLTVDLDAKNNVDFRVLSRTLKEINFISSQSANLKYNFNEKLTLASKFENKLNLKTINDVQERIYIDKLELKYTLDNSLNYKIIDKEDEKLTFNSSLGLTHSYEFNYVLDGNNIPFNPKEKEEEKDLKEIEIPKKPEITFTNPASSNTNTSGGNSSTSSTNTTGSSPNTASGSETTTPGTIPPAPPLPPAPPAPPLPPARPRITLPPRTTAEVLSNSDNDKLNKLLKSEIDLEKLNNPEKRSYGIEPKLLLFIQEYKFDSNLEYSKTIDKLTIKPKLNLNAKLDVISLVSEKMSKEDASIEDKEENRVKLEESTFINRKYNVGGKIEMTPKLEISYNFTDSLSLTTLGEVKILFEKKVLNKINDEKRTDNGTYSLVDKIFKLRNISPKLGLELTYKW